MAPILQVKALRKIYTRGLVNRKQTFSLNADFSVPTPEIVGVLGPNGSGKTTLFEILSGSNRPTSGQVICAGQDVHQVKYRERDRMVIHYHQSYQVRSVKKSVPSFMLQAATWDYPLVHVFDEPQFSTQDGYIGFMLSFGVSVHAPIRALSHRYHARSLRPLSIRLERAGSGAAELRRPARAPWST